MKKLTLDEWAFCSLLLLCVLKCSCNSSTRDVGLIMVLKDVFSVNVKKLNWIEYNFDLFMFTL